ncbi:hypothetical protein C8R47DRAFT_1120444 [Mycena vitilis]|nr:hypothetical protein C8R47DRAFT_1120444 [Mycena vitilis]
MPAVFIQLLRRPWLGMCLLQQFRCPACGRYWYSKLSACPMHPGAHSQCQPAGLNVAKQCRTDVLCSTCKKR